MKIKPILSALMIFIISLLLESCFNGKEPGIVGKWNRLNNDNLSMILEDNRAHWGDITFLGDSTFTISSDLPEDSSTAPVPGWHIGEIKGKYSIEENHLYLKSQDWVETFLSLNYEIIELTNKKLVLLSVFDKGDTAQYLIYSRDE